MGFLGKTFNRRSKAERDFAKLAIEVAERRRFRPTNLMPVAPIVATQERKVDDASLVARIIKAYRGAQALSADQNSFWSDHHGGRKASIHQLLMCGTHSEVSAALRSPHSNDLFYGFDSLCLWAANLPGAFGELELYDLLLRLAEATGAIRLFYPEVDLRQNDSRTPSVEEILRALETHLERSIQFPNPYSMEVGLASSRGVISWRAIQAVFQACEIVRHLKPSGSCRVVEIGAGLGRTAYYAHTGGVKSYTIVDIPLTNVAQAYFLGRALGEDRIALFGEVASAPVRIIPPEPFYESNDQFDIALNADSFTEMSRETAEQYIVTLAKRCPTLLSINHEFNQFTVREICRQFPDWTVERHPYWMRKGYVQETIRFGDAASGSRHMSSSAG